MADDPALTPPQLAKRYGCKPEKILAWIRSGELQALNLATTRGGRPRWRITPEAIAAFERSRTATPPPPVVRRRRRTDPHVTQYF